MSNGDKKIIITQKSGMGSHGEQNVTYIENQYVSESSTSEKEDEFVSLTEISSLQPSFPENIVESLIGGQFAIAKISQVKNIHNLYPYLLLFDKALLINFMNVFDDALYSWYDTSEVFTEGLEALRTRLSCYEPSSSDQWKLNKKLEEQKNMELPKLLSAHIDAGLVDNFIISKEIPDVVPLIREESKNSEEKIIKYARDNNKNILDYDDEEELAWIASIESKKIYMDMLVDTVSNSRKCVLTDLKYTSSLYRANKKINDPIKEGEIDKLRVIALGLFGRTLNSIPNFSNISLDDFLTLREKTENERSEINRTLHRLAREMLRDLPSFTSRDLVKEIDRIISLKILPDLGEYNKLVSANIVDGGLNNLCSEFKIGRSSLHVGNEVFGSVPTFASGDYDYSVFLNTLHKVKQL